MHPCFFFVLLAGGAASLASLALSKTLYRGATTSGYLLFHFFIGFLFTALLNGVFFSAIPFNWRVALVGCAVGLLTSVMMFMMGKALRNGPSGLTFAFQNSGAILPPLLLAFIFSKPFGFTLSAGNLVGMAL
ncbi:MAG TPA: hypothetical protein VEK06_01830, partial [Myxococcota bacterium]|nr:hypothetical protein [Myxococcota bacterium]